MSSTRYTPEFKGEVVKQIIERSYSISEVSEYKMVSDREKLYKMWGYYFDGMGNFKKIQGINFNASRLQMTSRF